MRFLLRPLFAIAILVTFIGLCDVQAADQNATPGSKPAESDSAQSESPTSHGVRAGAFDPTRTLRVQTVHPDLDQPIRPWVDVTGKRAVVAKLLGEYDGKMVFQRADGKRISTAPAALSAADRVYAIHQTARRVSRTSQVLLGKIFSASDGDTIRLMTIGGLKQTIRLDGIDAPESKQDYGLTSKKYLQRFVGRDVRVEYLEEDRYGRIVGQIYFTDRWVNYELVLAGLAWHYDKYNVDGRLAGAHVYAKQKKRGLWQQPQQIAPWDYRNGVRKKTTEPLNVDSIRATDTVVFITGSGHRYHTEACHHAKDGTPIPLSRAASAYERCAICKPPQ